MTQPDPPPTIVFEVNTARRVGAQLRYNGGPHLDEIRAATRTLTGWDTPPVNTKPPPSGGGFGATGGLRPST